MSESSQAVAIEQAARFLIDARYVMAMTGAGISVESGIPPFRGPGGLWTKYGEPPMNGYQQFLDNPKAAWEARLNPTGPMAILRQTVADAQPNPGHEALVALEEMNILRFMITQNIDNLHRRAGSRNLVEIHGNSTLTRCLQCTSRFPLEETPLDVLPPTCPQCNGMVKIDTVAFGEPIPPDALAQCQQTTNRCDCMMVIGTSATVFPAAAFPMQVCESGGILIEVNPYESDITPLCAVSLRGPSGEMLPQLVAAIQALRDAQG